ncbi:MAG: cell division protein FtsZ [Candidatus Thermoplasmatota archaeon]|nr:cell division protein FtsZ [Candidatus Thermoplasmatota archaeon]
MESIVDEALSQAENEDSEAIEKKDEERRDLSTADEELKEVLSDLKTDIKIVGVGGAGCNTVERISEEGIQGGELIAANTDAQHLLTVHSQRKVLLGRRKTKGLGAGALPQVGQEATEEAKEKLDDILEGSDLVFVTCGLGGGTGTGGAPVIAEMAKQQGALTVAVCTTPFEAEGSSRMENAEWGLKRLRNVADTVITIPNDKLLELCPRLSLNKAFKVADEVLTRSIKGMTELVTKPGLVNLDFNDLKTVMEGAGVAMIGMGEDDSENRSEVAIKEAINSPLLEVDISDANAALINVVGGNDMTVSEAEEAAKLVESKIGKDARIIWGASVEPTQENTLKVMVVITGVKSKQIFGSSVSAEEEEIQTVA